MLVNMVFLVWGQHSSMRCGRGPYFPKRKIMTLFVMVVFRLDGIPFLTGPLTQSDDNADSALQYNEFIGE